MTAGLLVRAPAESVYGFLTDLSNHERISGDRFHLRALSADRLGARITMRGPLGIRRTAHTTITDLRPCEGVSGMATVGRRTTGALEWIIIPAAGGTRVSLTATVIRLSPLDRLLFTLGGRRWLTRGFTRAIRLMSTILEAAEPAGSQGELA